jgi:hypothetical protein
VRATFKSGPVGTGTYLVGRTGSWAEPDDGDVWLLVLFFPLVPLARWRTSGTPAGGDGPEPEAVALTLHSRSRVPVRSALLRIARAVGATLLALAPLALGAWRIGSPWAAPALTVLVGPVPLLDKLGMAVELGLVLAGAALPLLVLMRLDERTPRVDFFRRGGHG